MTRAWLPFVSGASLLLAAAILAALLDVFALPPSVRVIFVLAFLAVGPGHGWIGALGLKNLAIEVALMAGLGLSLALLVSLAMAVFDMWSPLNGMLCLALFHITGTLVWWGVASRRAATAGPTT